MSPGAGHLQHALGLGVEAQDDVLRQVVHHEPIRILAGHRQDRRFARIELTSDGLQRIGQRCLLLSEDRGR